MSMSVKCLEVGSMMANCYLVSCDSSDAGIVIDPGGDGQRIVEAVQSASLRVERILNSHCHPDHVDANLEVREATGGNVMVHEAEREFVEAPSEQLLLLGFTPRPCVVDATFEEGDEISVNGLALRVMHLPGHSPGSSAFIGEGVAFTGDTLFAGGIGRTDFPGGDTEQIMASLARLARELPPETIVYPGHGPSTTIARELEGNPWLSEM